MMMVKHRNIVRFLGFCSQTEEQAQELGNAPQKVILAETRERLECFEYMSNGSLDSHISGMSMIRCIIVFCMYVCSVYFLYNCVLYVRIFSTRV